MAKDNVMVQTFSNDVFGNIRIFEENGETLFCDSDVAKALGYARPADAISSHCKGVCVLPTPSVGGVMREYTYDTPYGVQTGLKTYVTGKGQIYFIEKLRKQFLPWIREVVGSET